MRTRRIVLGSIALGACAIALRFGARALFRVEESRSSVTKPCGALTYRTTTVTHRSPFAKTSEIVQSESTVERNEQVLARGISRFHCGISATTRVPNFAALVVESARPTEVKLLGSASTHDRAFRFEHPVENMAWSSDGESFAAIGKTDISVQGVREVAPATVITRGPAVVSTSIKWSPDDTKLCWISEGAPAGGDRPVEMWCRTRSNAPAAIAWARAAVNESVWVGFERGTPHLCGDAVTPRDITCRIIPRDTDL